MKIVVIDSEHLPAGVEFSPLQANKYGWEQYRGLDDADIAERCWRSDIVISLATRLNAEVLEKMIKLGLVITAGAACDQIDVAAVNARDIKLLAFPDVNFADAAQGQQCCDQMVSAIDEYILAMKTGDEN